MRIYVDCTETYKSRLNTGIQRVVNKIVNFIPQYCEITPVYFDEVGLAPVDPKVLDIPYSWKPLHALLLRTPFFNLAKKTYYIYLKIKAYFKAAARPSYHYELKKGDVLLVADIIRSEKYIKALQDLKRKGVHIYQVVFDILPVTYPQFFRPSDSKDFKRRLHLYPTFSSKIFAISHKVAKEVQNEINFQNVDVFHLGADFVAQNHNTSIETVFPKSSYFLSVGTIEPRKNHEYILNAFTSLWEKGIDKKLVFIGRLGWKFEDILPRINSISAKYPDKFKWLSNANDDVLQAHYQNAAAIICASHDEGFGLPIVEALNRGKQVLASDIEVFREVGGALG